MAITKENMSINGHNKTFGNSERITYEKKLTIERHRSWRSGYSKLSAIIFDLRSKGFKDGDEILYDDVEDAIWELCGIDDRTVKKYIGVLVKRAFLKPCGRPIKKRSHVTVKTFSRVDASPRLNPKEYVSDKGHSAYRFGVRAPHLYVEQMLLPPSLSLPPNVIRERVE